MIGILAMLVLDFACIGQQFPDQNAMCVAMTMQDQRIAQCSSENLELLGKIAQLEKYVLRAVEATPTPQAAQ